MRVVGADATLNQKTGQQYFSVRVAQIVGVVLWLYSQVRKGRAIPRKCMHIVEYALSNGWENDFSFSGVERQYLSTFDDVLSKPLNLQQEAAARALMAEMEAGRQKSME